MGGRANLRAGLAQDWVGTVPAGQIGVWSSHGTANTFDNFNIRDVAGPFEVDGRWFCEHGEVQVDAANSNVLEVTSSNSFHMHVIRRGMRAGKYVATARFKWNASASPGLAARWIGPSDSAYVAISPSDGKARLFLRESGAGTTLATSGTVLSLTTNNWYTMKLVIGDDLANSALQRLRFWVDTDDDGDFADETALLDSTAIDDEWSAGHVGLYRGGPAAQQFDDFRSGYDNNADLDINDAGDDVLVSDDFATNVVSPTYDNNGNSTFDGIYNYVYDGWDRPRIVKLGAEGDLLTVQELTWYGTHRVVARANSNMGVENTPGDGGNATTRFYTARGKLIEERNGSGQTTVQNLWGPGAFRGWLGTWPVRDRNYAAIVCFERNGDPSIGNDTNPDVTASGESSETPADKRYFYAFDRTGTPAAMTNYTSGGGGTNGQIAERYSRGAHGSRIIQRGDSGSGEGGGMIAMSSIGAGAGQTLPCNQDYGSINSPHPVYMMASGGGGGDCSDNSPTEPIDPVEPTGPCPAGEVAWGGGCIPEKVDTTSYPPPTIWIWPPCEQEQCDDAWNKYFNAQREDSQGITLCDRRANYQTPCTCVFSNEPSESAIPYDYESPAGRIVRACIEVHEQSHAFNIRCPGTGPLGPGFGSPTSGHCRQYAASASCYGASLSSCNCDLSCLIEIGERIATHAEHCNRFNPTRCSVSEWGACYTAVRTATVQLRDEVLRCVTGGR